MMTERSPLLGRHSPGNTWHKKALGAILGICCISAVLSIIYYFTTPSSNSPDRNESLHNALFQQKHGKNIPEFIQQNRAMLDESVNPCDDFYEYACGNWLKTVKLQNAASIDTSFYVVGYDNAKTLTQMIEREDLPVIGDYYKSCMNSQGLNGGLVTEMITKINNAKSVTELMVVGGNLYMTAGISSFIGIDIGADPKNASLNVVSLSQGGLLFPTREYYLDSTMSAKYSENYHSYIKKLFELQHLNTSQGDISADILRFETDLANISLSNEKLRDPWKTYHKLTSSDLTADMPLVKAYLLGIKSDLLNNNSYVVVSSLKTLQELSANLLIKHSLKTLKNYLILHVLDSLSSFLGSNYRSLSFKFHGALSGLTDLPDQKSFCEASVVSMLGDFVGKYYIKEKFDSRMYSSAKSIIKELELQLKKLLASEAWLDEKTRISSLSKLDAIKNLVGGPSLMSNSDGNYENFPVIASNVSFLMNSLSISSWNSQRSIKRLNLPVNRKQWDMTASTVNAYYDPTSNKIVFPAAIFQPPFFSENYETVIKYAGIGMVIGHELSHGFDDEGRNYNGKGELAHWWSSSVAKKFKEKAQCLIDQYSRYPVYSIKENKIKKLIGYVNGKLTLGENIADNGGIKIAFKAYQDKTKHTNQEKYYFLAFAQRWCEKRSDAYSEQLLNLDPHSPGKWRVNGPLQNFDEFAKAFKCPVGSPMNPKKKCVIW